MTDEINLTTKITKNTKEQPRGPSGSMLTAASGRTDTSHAHEWPAKKFTRAIRERDSCPSFPAEGRRRASPPPTPRLLASFVAFVTFVVNALALSCVDRLPAEDRRITIVQPLAKLSAVDLWNDYQTDAASANRRYFGEAVEVSGKVTGIDQSGKGGAVVMFGQTETLGIRAVLLGDQEADILKAAKVNERLTLRCFVEGKSLEGHVGLRSCIRP